MTALKTAPVQVDLSLLADNEIVKPYANLLQWTRENKPAENLIYKEAFGSQIVFIRDTCFTNQFLSDLKTIEVVSTHKSKSVSLPVYHVVLSDGTEFIIRGNFYDWKITVVCKKELQLPQELFSHDTQTTGGDGKISSHYFEGFSHEWIYPVYNFGKLPENRKCFSVEVHNEYQLYTMMFLIKSQLGLGAE